MCDILFLQNTVIHKYMSTETKSENYILQQSTPLPLDGRLVGNEMFFSFYFLYFSTTEMYYSNS